MKNFVLMLVIITVTLSFSLTACVSTSTRYIDIKQATPIWWKGEKVTTIQPGGTLRILSSQKCWKSDATCLTVVDEQSGQKGIVSENKMNNTNHIYTEGNKTEEKITKSYHTQVKTVGEMVTMQLAYDDGKKERNNSPWSESAGSEIGVVFSSPTYPATVEKASFYVSNSSNPTTAFKVNIYQLDQNRMPKINLVSTSITANAKSGNQWVDVDLTPYNIVVKNDFMVSMEWLSPHHPKKGKDAQVLGTDMSNHDGRSYWKFTDREGWRPVNKIGKSGDRNNMIRTTVKYKTSLVVSGSVASKTKYIEVKTPTKLHMRGEVVATAQPGDTLKIIGSKTCRSGNGTCWKVKNEKDSTGGIVKADDMEIMNRVYEVERK